MSRIKCSIAGPQEKALHESFKEKFPKHKGISLRLFNNKLSVMQSDSTINFNYLQLMEEGKEDLILDMVAKRIEQDKKTASDESLAFQDYKITDTDESLTKDNIVTVSNNNGYYKFNVLRNVNTTTEQVGDIIESIISSSGNLPTALQSNMRNNIKTYEELKSFMLYYTENKLYNELEEEENKLADSDLIDDAMHRLNKVAKLNEGLKEARQSYRPEDVPNNHSGVVQIGDSSKKGLVSFNTPITDAKQAYRERRQANINSTDATIMIDMWDAYSPGEIGTRNDANSAEKLILDVKKPSEGINLESLADSVVESLKSKGIDISKPISLNIAGNAIDKIAAKGSSQEKVNLYTAKLLKAIMDKGIQIKEIVTGGQTGIDEAGIIAAAALGIPYRIHTAAVKYNGSTAFILRESANKNTTYYLNNKNQMNTFLNRFNKEAIKKVRDALNGKVESKSSNTSSKNQATTSSSSNGLTVNASNAAEALAFIKGLSAQEKKGLTLNIGKGAGNTSQGLVMDETGQAVVEETSESEVQNLVQQKKQEISEKTQQEESRIQAEIVDKHETRLAKLHRVLGKNAPALLMNRMKMFSSSFSYAVNDVMLEYQDEQRAIIDDESKTQYERDAAKYNLMQSEDPEEGRKFVISQTGNRVIEKMKAELEDKLNSVEEEDEALAEYKRNHYQIALNYFDVIFDQAKCLMESREGIKIKGSPSTQISVDNSTDDDIEDIQNSNDDEENMRTASASDAIGFKARETDPHLRMSKAVKEMLRDIIKQHKDENGEWVPDVDDLGEIVSYNEDQLYAVLIKEFSYMKEPVDFSYKDDKGNWHFPALENIQGKYPWVEQVIDLLKDSLNPTQKADGSDFISTQKVSLFYSNFRNDFIPYWMNKNGKSFPLNTESASQSVLAMATDNFENANIISKHSLYDSQSRIILDNAKYWAESTKDSNGRNKGSKIQQILDFINHYDDYDLEDAEDNEKVRNGINDIIDAFASIGIAYDYDNILSFIKTNLGQSLIKDGLNALNNIMLDVIKNPNIDDFIDFAKSNIQNIGKSLDTVYEEYVQQSFREGDKTRYSYSTPNYIDTMIKFANEKNLQKRRQYLMETFGKYEWFYDKNKGVWKNEVLDLLYNTKDTSGIFDSLKDLPIIAQGDNKVEYTDWTPQMISAMFLSEYFQMNDSQKKTAYYNMPIFSDSPICKLIRMRRYTGDSTKSGSSTFKTQLLNKFVKIAEQELWRMKLIEDRKAAHAKEIVNFDKKGKEFCFFPALNKMTLESLVAGDYLGATLTLEDFPWESELMNRVRQENAGTDLSNSSVREELLKEAYRERVLEELNALEESIPKEYDENEEETSPSLMTLIRECNSQGKDFLKDALLKAAIEESISTSCSEFIESNAEGLYSSIQSLVHDKKLEDKSFPEDDRNIEEKLEDYRDELEEYFWNSCFATANIIQMTTTDLAFYKNATDFQKRYKEVYASGTKLNTQSKYGKAVETTVYLRDNIMTVPTYAHLRNSLLKAVQAGELHESEMEAILNGYMDITQTDAQAYRSVKSIRSVLDMLGQLTPSLDDMFERMLQSDYVPTQSDFNSLVQTIKPFFFGHDSIDSEVDSAGLMRVPHQNKNSEFTLFSSLGSIAAMMDSSPQLRALNRFMIDNDIDVVQFESAVKAGGQGIIDINWNPDRVELNCDNINTTGSYFTKSGKELDASKYTNKKGQNWQFESGADLKDFLDSQLKDENISQQEYNEEIQRMMPTEEQVINILYDNCFDGDSLRETVVHQHSYNDYMIATATPEHFFDAEAIFGSQFRNIIISDITSEDTFEINGRTYKGNEVKELYRKLIVENLLDSFEEVKKNFDNIYTLQAKMKSLIEGNPRYGDDMLDAIEIVKTPSGTLQFNIPLHNPTTTMKIQELLNSLWKSNVTKQKINGGAAILVSDFGFSNSLHVVRNEDGSIKEIECYMPAYSKKFYEKFLNKDGSLDYARMEKENPELLRLVGYRIPTEGKYSMLNLKIKGFLPQINGGAIMLPAEITRTAGSDFDKFQC